MLLLTLLGCLGVNSGKDDTFEASNNLLVEGDSISEVIEETLGGNEHGHSGLGLLYFFGIDT